MDAINQLIFNELAQRRRVILPGLGTLSLEQRSPAWQEWSASYSPPRTRIVFTPLEAEGPTLPELIARQSDIPLREVRPQYHAWLAEVKKGDGEGNLSIEGMGLLYRRPDGTYRVEPTVALERLLNPAGGDFARLPLPPFPTEQSAYRYPRRSRSPIAPGWWIAFGAVVLAAALVWCAFACGWFDSLRERMSRKEEVILVVPAEPMVVEPLPEPEPVEEPVVEPVPEPYQLIVGTFTRIQNAEKLVAEEGGRAEIFTRADGRFMVSIGGYATLAEAEAAKNRVWFQYPDAWVYEP